MWCRQESIAVRHARQVLHHDELAVMDMDGSIIVLFISLSPTSHSKLWMITSASTEIDLNVIWQPNPVRCPLHNLLWMSCSSSMNGSGAAPSFNLVWWRSALLLCCDEAIRRRHCKLACQLVPFRPHSILSVGILFWRRSLCNIPAYLLTTSTAWFVPWRLHACNCTNQL